MAGKVRRTKTGGSYRVTKTGGQSRVTSPLPPRTRIAATGTLGTAVLINGGMVR